MHKHSSGNGNADFTLNFFYGIRTPDIDKRKEELNRVCDLLFRCSQVKDENSLERELVLHHLPTVLRLSQETPFEDVRDAFRNLLNDMEKAGLTVPRRRYRGPSVHIPITTDEFFHDADEEKRNLFIDMFMHDIRCSHFMQLLNVYPEYARKALDTYHFILMDDGPLPLSWRNYIALIAASRHSCKYFMDLQESLFHTHGGASKWLKGIEYTPKKMQVIQELNCILAHRPWLLNDEYIRTLVKGGWSMGEIAHIALLMTTIHSLCGLVLGLAVTPEIDSVEGHTFAPPTPTANSGLGSNNSSKVNSMNNISNTESWSNTVTQALKDMKSDSGDSCDGGLTFAENVELFEKLESLDDTIMFSVNVDPSSFSKFTSIGNVPFEYEDYDVKSDKYEVFRELDYSWNDHAYSLLTRLYSSAPELIDDQFNVLFGMTDNQIGSEQVDTTEFRYAIWYYVHRLNGILHDDFDYSKVNKLLARPLKTFIKKIVCAPSQITTQDYRAFSNGLRSGDQIHICLLAIEARKQAQLIYFSNAVYKYMN